MVLIMANCIVCGKFATNLNSQKQPVCSKHVHEKAAVQFCEECGAIMVLRKSKFGSFWGCSAFPVCTGTKRI